MTLLEMIMNIKIMLSSQKDTILILNSLTIPIPKSKRVFRQIFILF